MSAAGLDWQFIVVTLAAAWGGWVLLRPLWPARDAKKPVGACGRCSSSECGKEAAAPLAAAGLVRIGSGTPRKPKSPESPPPGISA